MIVPRDSPKRFGDFSTFDFDGLHIESLFFELLHLCFSFPAAFCHGNVGCPVSVMHIILYWVRWLNLCLADIERYGLE